MNPIYITVSQAATLSRLTVHTIVNRIKRGKLDGRIIDGQYNERGDPLYEVRLDSLSLQAQQAYWEAEMKDDTIDIDIVSRRELGGNRASEVFIRMLTMVNEAAQIEREHASDGKITVNKEALAARYGISRPTISCNIKLPSYLF